MGSSSAVTVAQNALVVRDGFSYVFKVGADSRAVQMKVLAGRRLEGRIEILDGLTPDAQVVTAGAGFLSDGDLVRVENGAGSPAKKSESGKKNPEKMSRG
jgi:HlyD family secretion protein